MLGFRNLCITQTMFTERLIQILEQHAEHRDAEKKLFQTKIGSFCVEAVRDPGTENHGKQDALEGKQR